jgi:tripartite-type tricarboxylate transporter receptor subunit TctC
LLLALSLIVVAVPARAQSDYPNKPIILVVPLPPGGTNDILARAVADRMSAALGQQIVVENRPAGGSGTVASRGGGPRP